MVRGGAEYQVQEAMKRAVANWSKTFLRDTNAGLRDISQAASRGVQGDLMSNERWGKECMLQLQEDENWNKPTATTWAAEFLLRGEKEQSLSARCTEPARCTVSCKLSVVTLLGREAGTTLSLV